MNHQAPVCFVSGMLALFLSVCGQPVHADPTSDVVKSITITAPRNVGYFAGDLVFANVTLVVADGTMIETASLPHPGPINYWLNLRTIDVGQRADGRDRRYTLKLVYQNFYDALDARPQEIPTFPVRLKSGDAVVLADIPAWTIGVSSLREVAPPVKDDPKDYMQPDRTAPYIMADRLRLAALATFVAAAIAMALLAFDRAWWPFHARPDRVFGGSLRRLRKLGVRGDTEDGYLEALLVLHRGIDQTDGRRVLADDVSAFLRRHPTFVPLEEHLTVFFSASRHAFFGSDPARARKDFPFGAVEALARKMAAAERTEA